MKPIVLSESFSHLKIGDIFTPQKWAEFAIIEFGLFSRWMNGATIFDPTMGTGNLLESLVTTGLKRNHTLSELPIQRLFGNEINTEYHKRAIRKFHEKFDVEMSNNFWNYDLFDISTPLTFDIIFGNPPWQNFVDLPPTYKEKAKSLFAKYDLIGNMRDLLLGGSRMDIAALIIQVAIKNFLKPKGDAIFFMPLSLLLNDGANAEFRNYNVNGTCYAPKIIFDFNKENVFKKIATRYGLVHFRRDETPEFPLEYRVLNQTEWLKLAASPLQNPTNPLSIYKNSSPKPLNNFSSIELPKTSMPRQGINTCGANHVFFFKTHKKTSKPISLVNNNIELPSNFVYPLLTSSNFINNNPEPRAWALLPYHKKGHPISAQELEAYPELKTYLNNHQEKLSNRKGTYISGWIKKGYWWALLGVGTYNFAPYKIVWEAYGKKTFNPILVEGNWQANQALQAFIPFQTKQHAETILKQLKNPAIEEYLLSLRMEGTMNWAQPGKIKKLIKFIS